MPEVNEKVYKLIEVTGTSPVSMEAAMENAIEKASKIETNLEWFELLNTRGMLDKGRVSGWRVTIKIRAVL
ncbi:MAG: dodecin domain-containing protein [Anaerolineae bacterium]|nr:dodecin domain-containing protein [Anaerolineae bacterium]